MSNNHQSGRGVYGKGYYIALVLCAAAIGIAGFFYYRNAQQVQPVLQEPEQATVSVDATEDHVSVIATRPAGDADAAIPEPPKAPEKKELQTAAPVSGQTVADYAMDCLSYNQTTRDWRVHNGMDIGAEPGTEVLAAADGVVYTTYTDDIMGTTVVIRHEGGYTTQYASLSEELKVSAGDEVALGQPIGTVGETALIETSVGPHVHFSVLLNDASIDPNEFLGIAGE